MRNHCYLHSPPWLGMYAYITTRSKDMRWSWRTEGVLFERQERITNKFHQLLCSYPSFIFNFLFLHLQASQQRSFPTAEAQLYDLTEVLNKSQDTLVTVSATIRRLQDIYRTEQNLLKQIHGRAKQKIFYRNRCSICSEYSKTVAWQTKSVNTTVELRDKQSMQSTQQRACDRKDERSLLPFCTTLCRVSHQFQIHHYKLITHFNASSFEQFFPSLSQ